MLRSLVGSEMCIRDRNTKLANWKTKFKTKSAGPCLSGAYGCGNRVLVCCSAVAVSCSAVAVSCSGIVAVADSRSAICNLLVLGPANTPDHHPGPGLLGFLVLPRASRKPHGICMPQQGARTGGSGDQPAPGLPKWSQNDPKHASKSLQFRRCFRNPRFFEKCNTLHTKTLFFEARGVPKWSQKDPRNASKIKLLGSVAGLGALAPLEIRPLSL